MEDKQRQHSGIDTVKRIVSAARIAKAAAAGGVHGAAVAAAKEAAPFLAKLAIWVLVALIALPMLIFAYLPNIFFLLCFLLDSFRFPHDRASHDVGRVLYGSGGL